MHRNPFWILFLSTIILGILSYSTFALIELWFYVRLDSQTQAQSIQYSIMSHSDEAFIPQANYSFQVQNKTYQNQTSWNETYLNKWTAQEAIDRLEKSPPPVWYDSSSPQTSTLQKNFPLKTTLYALLLWILGIYFVGIGYFVHRRLY